MKKMIRLGVVFPEPGAPRSGREARDAPNAAPIPVATPWSIFRRLSIVDSFSNIVVGPSYS
ncbi:MAG: hypothetical protein OSA98_23935, partial [Rubripirellula sp.]|nr:hypothetical protein [Rubripirellula sp.]